MASKATDVDRKFGELLQDIRGSVSRKELAKQLTVSTRQLEKYEKGVNRLSPSRMVEIKEALNVKFIDLIPPEYLD